MSQSRGLAAFGWGRFLAPGIGCRARVLSCWPRAPASHPATLQKNISPSHDLPPSHCQTFLPAPRNLLCPHFAKPLGPGRLCVSRQCRTLWAFFQIPLGLIQPSKEEIQGPLGQPLKPTHQDQHWPGPENSALSIGVASCASAVLSLDCSSL